MFIYLKLFKSDISPAVVDKNIELEELTCRLYIEINWLQWRYYFLYRYNYKICDCYILSLFSFSYLYPYMGWGKCSFQRADPVEGYGVRDIWITWKESERRTFRFFGFSSYLYKIPFSFIIFFSQLYKKDWK